jgi:predicted Zn-dependent peptidase
MDIFSITNLKLYKPLSNIPQFQNLSPTPRIVMRNANTPKAPPFQQIFFHPSYPNRTRPSKNAPNMSLLNIALNGGFTYTFAIRSYKGKVPTPPIVF